MCVMCDTSGALLRSWEEKLRETEQRKKEELEQLQVSLVCEGMQK